MAGPAPPWPSRSGLLDPRNDPRCWSAPPAGDATTEGLIVARGKHVYLRTLMPEDLELLSEWCEDPTLDRLVGSDFLRAYREIYDKQPAFYEAVLTDPTQIVLMIVELVGRGRPVGLVRLYNIHVQDGYAGLEIIVADARAWRWGLGIQAGRLMGYYAVDVLGLRRLESKVYEYNTLSINSLLRNGFTREGVLRQAAARDGRNWDIVIFGILREEIERQRKRDRYLSG